MINNVRLPSTELENVQNPSKEVSNTSGDSHATQWINCEVE